MKKLSDKIAELDPVRRKKVLTRAIKLASETRRIVYMCVICKKDAEDPCAIGITTNWSKPEKEQEYQQFWCHRECFEKVIAPEKLDI